MVEHILFPFRDDWLKFVIWCRYEQTTCL